MKMQKYLSSLLLIFLCCSGCSSRKKLLCPPQQRLLPRSSLLHPHLMKVPGRRQMSHRNRSRRWMMKESYFF